VERRCEHCGGRFMPRKNVARQRYCSKVGCQEARRNQWRRKKLLADPDYRGNQYDSQKRWRESHRDYWSAYRAAHPGYVERNRALQRERNHRRKKALIAKSDELTSGNSMRSGFYRLRLAGAEAIAKSDEYLVKIDVLSGTYLKDRAPRSFFPDCKQIT